MSRYLGTQRCGGAIFCVKQQDITLVLVTTFLKELPLRRKKKSGLGINKHHGKDIIIPFKSIISDGCEVAAVK